MTSDLCKIRPAAAASMREQAALKQPMRVLNAKAASKATAHSRWLRAPYRSNLLPIAVLIVVGFYLYFYFYPYVQSYGEGMLYYWVVPFWARRLIETMPEPMTPVHLEGSSDTSPPVEGARKVGPFWVSTLATSPNITLVHNFMTYAECDEIVRLGRVLGLEGSEERKASNPKTSSISKYAGLFGLFVKNVYNVIRTSTGVYISEAVGEELASKGEAGARDRFFDIMHKGAQLTSLAMENMEHPFLQRYDPGQQFRAHNDAYDARNMNIRSKTLLAYLADTDEGGETEFMKLPLVVKPRKGTAIIWSNCNLQPNTPSTNTSDPEAADWDELRGECKGGAGPSGTIATQVGPELDEIIQHPCCIARDEQSLHQSRPVLHGSSKWTVTLWMHQRFTIYGTYRHLEYVQYRETLRRNL